MAKKKPTRAAKKVTTKSVRAWAVTYRDGSLNPGNLHPDHHDAKNDRDDLCSFFNCKWPAIVPVRIVPLRKHP